MKNLMRVLSVLLIATMLLALVACGNDEKESSSESETLDLGSSSDSESASESETESESESESESVTIPDDDKLNQPEMTIPTLTAFEIPASSALKLTTVQNAFAPEDCQKVSLSYSKIYEGSLILVNHLHELKADIEDELVNISENRAKDEGKGMYQLSDIYGVLHEDALTAANKWLTAYYNTMSKDNCMMIAQAYRDYETQAAVFENAYALYGADVLKYSMKPNNSDFRTGYALNLKYYKDNLTYGLNDKKIEEQSTKLAELADDYGFIFRYPNANKEYTGLVKDVMPGLYRYVGVPHARVMAEGGYCLEEYIAGVKNYTADNRLRIEDGANVYQVFYVPAVIDGNTEILIPNNATYSVSGNNIDGFIVTLTMAK